MFLRNKFGNYPNSTIKTTICDFFRDDEIIYAKKCLQQAVNDKGINIQQFCNNCVGNNKTKANTDDIINIWTIIDENNYTDLCTVVLIYHVYLLWMMKFVTWLFEKGSYEIANTSQRTTIGLQYNTIQYYFNKEAVRTQLRHR